MNVLCHFQQYFSHIVAVGGVIAERKCRPGVHSENQPTAACRWKTQICIKYTLQHGRICTKHPLHEHLPVCHLITCNERDIHQIRGTYLRLLHLNQPAQGTFLSGKLYIVVENIHLILISWGSHGRPSRNGLQNMYALIGIVVLWRSREHPKVNEWQTNVSRYMVLLTVSG
jgi:hypothetical protein